MPASAESWEDVALEGFDLAIFCCGYEARSPYISKHVKLDQSAVIWLDYESVHKLSYDDNVIYFNSLNGRRVRADARIIEQEIGEILAQFLKEFDKDREAKILFDVSSCSRKTMAQVLLAVRENIGERGRLYCTYALSTYGDPPNSETPSHISEPVVGDLSGWSEDLSKPPCAVIGLGFEPGRALGCLDYLEIPGVHLFLPHGPDVRFEEAVVQANQSLIMEAGEDAVLHYDVLNPGDAYQKLESLLFGLAPRSRPVIIPLGPKIFSAVAIAIAVQMLPKVCVWRTSAGISEDTPDRAASGHVSCFSITMDSTDSLLSQ